VVDGTIIDRHGKPYYGSSFWHGYDSIVESSRQHIKVDVLAAIKTDEYRDLIARERELQLERDVVADTRFFNKSIAGVNTFADPNYATFRHTTTNKTVRLRRDHPLVIAGLYRGVTSGMTFPERDYPDRSGSNNPFYGKRHPDHVIRRIAEQNRGSKRTEDVRIKMSEQRTGVPKAEDHRRKLGRPGLMMVRNVATDEVRRVPVDDYYGDVYDRSLWFPNGMFNAKKATCEHCGTTSTPANISRWHNDNCSDVTHRVWCPWGHHRYNPKHDEIYLKIDQLADIITCSPRAGRSTKAYGSEVVWPAVMHVYGVDYREHTDRSFVEVIRRCVREITKGRFDQQSRNSWKEWYESKISD